MGVNMVRCDKCGSFYNSEATPSCPYCSGEKTLGDAGATIPVSGGAADAGRTVPIGGAAFDDGRTVPVSALKDGTNPVVGWLVGISGSEKGRDYRIHAEHNYIGRSEKMDIVLKGDETISRENHAFITYDDREKVFYLTSGEGRSIVRLNGKALLTPSELHAYDRIEIGKTELLFIPLCGEQFTWKG
ncbi:MAG: FHA domain-containing protein [Lachnospiraceae bacterium]|nr:FHA domain-containing protein [Lachnospiraceae bacterium]